MVSGTVRRALLPPSGANIGLCKQLSGLLGQPGAIASQGFSAKALKAVPSQFPSQTYRQIITRGFARPANQPVLYQIRGQTPTWNSPIAVLRQFSTTRAVHDQRSNAHQASAAQSNPVPVSGTENGEAQAPLPTRFEQSERAKQAAQVNYRARLSKEKDAKNKSVKSGEVVRLLKLARPELKYLGLALVLLLLSSMVTMSIPKVVGSVMDAASKQALDDAKVFGFSLYQFFGVFACVLTLGASANFGRIIVLRLIGERVVARLRSSLYKRTYLQDAEFFDANRTGDLISRLSADSIIVGKSITQNVSDGLRSLISGAAGITAMALISPGLTSIILFAAPFIGVLTFGYARFIRRISRDIQKNVGTLTKIAEERLSNVKTSQAFNGERQELHRYNGQIRRIFNLGMKDAMYTASFFGATGWMGNMTILAMLWFGGGYVSSGALSLGDLTSFMMYAAFAGSSMSGLSGFFTELMKGVGAATRLFELQDREPSIPPTKGVKVKSAQGPVVFDKVSFAYPTRPAVPIFKGLDFTIQAGSNVCIVGPSGGGKSTVASLILRFYNPTAGTIYVNGVDITTMNVKSLRRRIGVVSQEPVLFSGSVKDNIAYGRPEASESEVFKAAQEANCQFIKDFPEGMDTQVGPRGAQLSGGQKQRIAIARALLLNPDILILDEATSALDAESETLVNSALAKLLRGHSTTISIAHRLSTIKRSDQIIVLSNEGTVAEMGSYTSLSSDPNSAFSKLMEWQMSGGDVPQVHTPRHIPIDEAPAIDEELPEEDGEEIEEITDEALKNEKS
ncbi:ATP-dependent permease MDL2 [Truncatella angustata]|uniref:ATP-dependent permease MDL2 n=1 Tax=Truncatella angustata TaxID=152316 RepID=A0A9P8UNU7_9PEZI|nr:ATP-dependent permease MDL2 [Truncatella angustata]KAH6655339.1 ATP-dependent permease MDL2 [Truncatella angustata]